MNARMLVFCLIVAVFGVDASDAVAADEKKKVIHEDLYINENGDQVYTFRFESRKFRSYKLKNVPLAEADHSCTAAMKFVQNVNPMNEILAVDQVVEDGMLVGFRITHKKKRGARTYRFGYLKLNSAVRLPPAESDKFAAGLIEEKKSALSQGVRPLGLNSEDKNGERIIYGVWVMASAPSSERGKM